MANGSGRNRLPSLERTPPAAGNNCSVLVAEYECSVLKLGGTNAKEEEEAPCIVIDNRWFGAREQQKGDGLAKKKKRVPSVL